MGGLFRLIHKRYSPSIPRPARPLRLRERPLRPTGIALPRAYSRWYGQIRKCTDARVRAGLRGIRRDAWILGSSGVLSPIIPSSRAHTRPSIDGAIERGGRGGYRIAIMTTGARRADAVYAEAAMWGREKGQTSACPDRVPDRAKKQLAPMRVAEISLPREADRNSLPARPASLRRRVRSIMRFPGKQPGESDAETARACREENSLPPAFSARARISRRAFGLA